MRHERENAAEPAPSGRRGRGRTELQAPAKVGVDAGLLADGGRKCATPREPVLGIFGKGFEEHLVQVFEVGTIVAEPGRIFVQVLADDGDRVGVLERRRTGQQMKSRCGQGVLVCPPVDVGTRQLFRCGVGNRAHGDIGFGDAADVAKVASYTEVRQQDATFALFGVGEQDVGGFDVAVQQPAIVGIVKRAGDGLDDGAHLVDRHAVLIALLYQPGGIGAVDVVHGDPQLTVEFAAVVHTDDVRVPKRCGEICLPVEPFAELTIRGDRLGEDLNHIATRQPRVQGQIDLGHPAGAQRAQDRVAGERRAARDRRARPGGVTPVVQPIQLRGFRVRSRADRRDAARQVRGCGRKRLRARARGPTRQTRVAEQPSAAIESPGDALALVHLKLPPICSAGPDVCLCTSHVPLTFE